MKREADYFFKVFSLVPILFYILIMSVSGNTINQYLPRSVDGWIASGQDRYYYPETLFDYINGGAELFISYGFEQVVSRTYRRSGQPAILVEIFDMVESRNAFGVYTHAREKMDSTYGQGSQQFEGSIMFWKDRYYVSIVADSETREIKKAMKSMASKIDKSIRTAGALPGIVNRLPREGLIPESVFYFHHYVWANAFYYIADDNFLSITDKTDALLAKYGDPDTRYYLLLVEYPDPGKAAEAKDAFITHFAPELKEQDAMKLEDGSWVACETLFRLFICVLNGPGEKEATDLLHAVITRNKGPDLEQ